MRLLIALALLSCSTMNYSHGIPNLDRVDDNIYRGGQPTPAGCKYLHDVLHVTTWLKWSFEREGSSTACEYEGIRVEHYEMPPSDLRDLIERPKQDVVQAGLNAMARCKATGTICFEGCLHGQDRTGLLTALYRWLSGELTRDAAWADALAHGFHRELHELADVWEDWPR